MFCSCGRKLRRHLRQELDGFDDLLLQMGRARASTAGSFVGTLRDQIEAGGEKRQAGKVVEGAKALLALANQVMHAVRRLEVAHDAHGRPDLVEILGSRLIDARIALQDDAELVPVLNGLLNRRHGDVAPERDLRYGAREHDEVPHGDYEQHVLRQLGRTRSFDRLRFLGFVLHVSSGHGLEGRIWGMPPRLSSAVAEACAQSFPVRRSVRIDPDRGRMFLGCQRLLRP